MVFRISGSTTTFYIPFYIPYILFMFAFFLSQADSTLAEEDQQNGCEDSETVAKLHPGTDDANE